MPILQPKKVSLKNSKFAKDNPKLADIAEVLFGGDPASAALDLVVPIGMAKNVVGKVGKNLFKKVLDISDTLQMAKEIKIANKTSRTSGSVGKHATTPKFVRETSDKSESILDYGAGKDAAHTLTARSEGFKNVTPFEFGDNIKPDLHDVNALDRQYDTVYGSNVLNTQSSNKMFLRTLDEMQSAVKDGGRLVVNLPMSPRKMDINADKLLSELQKRFGPVVRVGGTKQAPMFQATK